MAGPIRAVDKQNVLPAVGVVVKKCAAGTERLGKQFATVRAIVMFEVDSCRTSHVGEVEPQGGLRFGPQMFPRCRKIRDKGRATERSCSQERTPVHGTFTRPLRIAYTTN